MFIYREPEEEVPEKEVQVQLPDLSTPAFGANRPVDNYPGVRCPNTINLSWKQNQKIIGVSFGASISAPQSRKRKAMIQFRQDIDLRLFPRDGDGNILPKWKVGTCAEINPWFHLAQLRPDLPIRTRTISVLGRTVKHPCKNCQKCHVSFLTC